MLSITPNLCRLCLDDTNSSDHAIDKPTKEIYKKITGLEIKTSDIPKKVCSSCHSIVLQIVTFQENCLKVETKLQKYFEEIQVKQESDGEATEINTADIFNGDYEAEKKVTARSRKLDDRDSGLYTCSFCSIQRTNLKQIRDHVDRHKVKWFQCPKCPRTSFSLDWLRQHSRSTKSHKKIIAPFAPLSCDNCPYTTCLQANMEKHWKAEHESTSRVECTCGTTFVCSDLRLQHQILQCSTVSQAFKLSHEKYFNVSPKRMNKSTRNICECCGKNVNSRVLKEHRLTCGIGANEKLKAPRYACAHCPNSYKIKNDLALHIKRIHLKIISYECLYCERKFTTWNARRIHMTKHDESLLNHVCSVCGKRFAGKYMLETHKTMHTNVRHYQCSLCDSAFKTTKMLKLHKDTVHEDTRSFACLMCAKTFKTRKTLSQHAQTHKDRAYKCPICPQAHFTVGHTLRNHMSASHPEFPMPPLGTNLKNIDLNIYWKQETNL